MHTVATLLLPSASAGILASVFRIVGDFYLPVKWAESIFSLVLAIITLVIAHIVRMKFKNAVALFGFEEGGVEK